MRCISLLLCILISFGMSAQTQDKIWVQFKDKNNSPYSITKPQDYLSDRAIERREHFGIPIVENDLPVNPQYLKRLEAKGVTIHLTSKWLNGALVLGDKSQIEEIESLPFVTAVDAVGRYFPLRAVNKISKPMDSKEEYKQKDGLYGFAENQIQQLDGIWLHNRGYRGKDMLIALIDGGFTKTDVMPFFDSLRVSGRLLQGWDFVNNDDYPYEGSSHGTQVLSTMAANLPRLMVGTAPDAHYVCLRTEEVGSELIVEEYNWVVGAEYADSIGADVINSSLGYTDFDKAETSHRYEDLDGKTTIVTNGADMAASKGILVVTSAGNEGADTWNFIGAPADGDEVLTVGAVDKYGNPAFFSSYGPSADGRVKPNVSATGSSTIVASLYGYYTNYADGTSFSSPVMAGMAASLWGAFPDKTNLEIIEALEKSAHRYKNPDAQMGHGVPNIVKAYDLLSQPAISSDPGTSVASNDIGSARSGEQSVHSLPLSEESEEKLRTLMNRVARLILTKKEPCCP